MNSTANDESRQPDADDAEASWRRLDRLLDTLLEAPETERADRLEEIRDDDAVLADRLQRLLGGLGRSVGLEAPGPSDLYTEALAQFCDLAPGGKLAEWTLIERIGRGGMAEVFKAEREINGAVQRAAIKVMALGLGGEAQRRRFDQETAILARLDDPRLSRLIDAGRTADRRPWLAMEFIDGEAIDRACDRLRLPIEDRVRLMIDVAMAVDQAHRQLIVHRDLKPGNVLLDNEGRVRVLDFGIAKVLAADNTDHEATATSSQAYTPRYACPEQLSGSVTGIAGDVYQLGLMLYLLLAGTRPFQDADDDPLRLLAAMRAGPVPPSRRWHAGATPSAQLRRSSPKRLARQLRGDLDSIVIQALEFKPDARYPGARELANDLQRWLEGHTIAARSYSHSYRIGRWLRRHWLGAAATAAIVVLLLGYAATATWQGLRLAEERNQAQQERDRAEAIHGFLLQLIGSVDPSETENRGKSADQLLAEGVDQAKTRFDDQPLLAAQLLVDLGQVLLQRGRLAESESAVTDALRIREEQLGPDHQDLVAPLELLSEIELRKQNPEGALSFQQRQLRIAQRHHGERSLEAINAMLGIAMTRTRPKELHASEALLKRALGYLNEVPDRGTERQNADSIRIRNELEHQLGLIHLHAGRYEEAATLLYDICERWTREYGQLHPRTLTVQMNLAFALRRLGRFDEARSVLEEVLASQREVYGVSHWQTAYTLGHIAALATDEGDFGRSSELWLEAEAEARASLEEGHPWPDSARFRAAEALVKGGRYEQAEPLLRYVTELENRSDTIADEARNLLQETVVAGR